MTVNVYWLDETKKNIVQYDFVGKWTWDELYPAYDKALEMEKSQSHRVDVILDFLKSNSIPPNLLTHIKGITDRQPDNIGLSVVVTTSRFFSVMYNTGIRFYPKIGQYFVIVETIEAAHQAIEVDRKRQSESNLSTGNS